MAGRIPLRNAARVIRNGGVIAYPTEGVFGLGCDPLDPWAVHRILAIKKRDPAMGLIVIASHPSQLDGWIEGKSLPEADDSAPITWIAPATPAVPEWVRGKHAGVAVRIVTHPVAAALCDEAGMPIISTSANFHGKPTARNTYVLRNRFRDLVDFIVPGRCGPAAGPSEIRDLASGRTLRKGSAG